MSRQEALRDSNPAAPLSLALQPPELWGISACCWSCPASGVCRGNPGALVDPLRCWWGCLVEAAAVCLEAPGVWGQLQVPGEFTRSSPAVDEAHSLLNTAPGTGDTAMSKIESLLPWSLPAAQGWTDGKISKMCHL